MNCPNVKECICPKTTCPNHGNCCKCVGGHRKTDSLIYDGSKLTKTAQGIVVAPQAFRSVAEEWNHE